MKSAVKKSKRPAYKVQVLDRAINILEFISRQSGGEAGLPELTDAMKLHKSTTHRIAHVLESRGFLRRSPDSTRYRLGLHLYDLGCRALDNVNIRDEARPIMTRLAFEVGETAHLAVLDRAEVLYIERVEAQRSLTMGSKLGARNPVSAPRWARPFSPGLLRPKSIRPLSAAAWRRERETPSPACFRSSGN